MSQLLELLSTKEGLEKSVNFEAYLKSRAFEKGIPLIGNFELTPHCTLDCTMCYVHLNKNQIYCDELKTEDWINLIDQACDAGMMYAVLTGGECLMYPGFKEIYEHLQSKGVLISVLTNGTLLDEAMVDWLRARSPQRVQISVYGSSPAGYKKVTGNGEAFHQVDKAIDLLINAQIPFTLAVTVSRQMVPDFEAILRYCDSKKEGVTRVNTCPFESRAETKRSFESFAPSLDEQVEVFKILIGADKLNLSDEEECNKTIRKRREVLPSNGIICMAGRYGFSMTWNGKMLPCSTFDFDGGFPLRDGFLDVWQIMNEKCRLYQNARECIDCEYYQVCRFCPAGHYMKVGEGHANPDVCNEGKRMVAEGIRFL